jgi:hypothetical protein
VELFSKHQGDLLAFFVTAMTSDVVAPTTGTRALGAYFAERIPKTESRES